MKTALFLRAFVLHWAVAGILFAPLQYLQAQDKEMDSGVEYFERHVRPLLAEKCFSCHVAVSTKVRSVLIIAIH